MEVKIYYEGWQLDCCGTPFAIGDTVKWACIRFDHADWVFQDADYAYEAHGASHYLICGTVASIDEIQYQYKEEDGFLLPISYTQTAIQHSGFDVHAYFVILHHATITEI